MTMAEILKKPYARMVIPDTDGSFVAEIAEFPGCMAVGSTATEALESLEGVAVDWIEAALAQGQSIPEPMETEGYSGKLVLRMPKSLHQRAALYAERDGVSLNQFITTCLAEHVGTRSRSPAPPAQPIQSVYAPLQMNIAVVGHGQSQASVRYAASSGLMTITTQNFERTLANA